MKKLAILSVLILSVFSTLAQTNVSGGIYQNATWSLAGSPYIVNGSVVVFPGVTLNIQPGVEIRINNQASSNIYIETRGILNCVGTDAQPIKIRTLYDTTNVGWQGFVCTSSQGGILNADRFDIANAFKPFAYEAPLANYQYTNSKFRHCFEAITLGNTVELNNCQFIDNETAVYGWSYFIINDCLFKDNNTSVFAYPTAFTMTNTQFIDNAIGVSFAAGVYDSLYISDCQFLNNLLAIGYPSNGRIENCIFNDNSTAIQYAYGVEIANNEFNYNELGIEASIAAEIHDNQLYNNFGAVLISGVSNIQDSPAIYDNEICSNINFAVNNNTNMNYSLLSNCFCDLDSAGIEAMIIDGYDDITKGLINYQIYDSTCTTLLGTVLKFGQGAGINEFSAELKFENPIANGTLIFSDAAIQTIEVQDLNGKTYSFSSSGSGKFDISILPAGFYMLSAIDRQKARKAFVKP
ncbi:MAG: hypothetical protein ACKOBN_04695 [Flavobacteriales bacterium]